MAGPKGPALQVRRVQEGPAYDYALAIAAFTALAANTGIIALRYSSLA